MNNHGGKRKGAGRPKGEKTITINCRINEECYNIWKTLPFKRFWLEEELRKAKIREAGV